MECQVTTKLATSLNRFSLSLGSARATCRVSSVDSAIGDSAVLLSDKERSSRPQVSVQTRVLELTYQHWRFVYYTHHRLRPCIFLLAVDRIWPFSKPVIADVKIMPSVNIHGSVHWPSTLLPVNKLSVPDIRRSSLEGRDWSLFEVGSQICLQAWTTPMYRKTWNMLYDMQRPQMPFEAYTGFN